MVQGAVWRDEQMCLLLAAFINAHRGPRGRSVRPEEFSVFRQQRPQKARVQSAEEQAKILAAVTRILGGT